MKTVNHKNCTLLFDKNLEIYNVQLIDSFCFKYVVLNDVDFYDVDLTGQNIGNADYSL